MGDKSKLETVSQTTVTLGKFVVMAVAIGVFVVMAVAIGVFVYFLLQQLHQR